MFFFIITNSFTSFEKKAQLGYSAVRINTSLSFSLSLCREALASQVFLGKLDFRGFLWVWPLTQTVKTYSDWMHLSEPPQESFKAPQPPHAVSQHFLYGTVLQQITAAKGVVYLYIYNIWKQTWFLFAQTLFEPNLLRCWAHAAGCAVSHCLPSSSGIKALSVISLMRGTNENQLANMNTLMVAAVWFNQ